MKKTIAILLVLVIGMVGVFAENKLIEIYTNITEVSTFAISAYNANDTTNYGKLISTSTWTSTPINKSVTSAAEDIAWLNVKTNSATGFTIDILGAQLENTAVAAVMDGETVVTPGQAANTTANKINYTLTVSGEASTGIAATPVFNTSTTTTAVNVVTLGAVNSLSYYNYKLNVDLLDSDYDNAASGLYTADITITFSAT